MAQARSDDLVSAESSLAETVLFSFEGSDLTLCVFAGSRSEIAR